MAKILLNVLHDAQERHGYLSEHALKQIAIDLDIPISQVWGTAKFYTMLKTEPQGKNVIEICGSPSCVLNNGMTMEKFLEKELGAKFGKTTKDGMFSLYKTSCIGCCDEAPAMLVNGVPHTKLSEERILQVIRKFREKAAKPSEKPGQKKRK
ncbi:MAG: NAD(P)H-dependent oxidoreductase subunit E [Candidatus Micrarchaeia archaeon]